MKRDYIDFNDRSIPLGYLITFRFVMEHGCTATSAVRWTDIIESMGFLAWHLTL